MSDLRLIAEAYEDGLRDGRARLLVILQQEGGEVKLYGLFEKDLLVDFSENREDLADREDIKSGMVIAEKTIKLHWEQNKWMRRGSWYPYPRQQVFKGCYNHPLTDSRYYSEEETGERTPDLIDLSKKRQRIIRTCIFCGTTEEYSVSRDR